MSRFFLIPSKVKILSNVNIYYLGFQIFMFIALYQINPYYYSFFYSINTRYHFIYALLFISVLVARARSDVRLERGTQGRLTRFVLFRVFHHLGFFNSLKRHKFVVERKREIRNGPYIINQ